MLFSQYELKLGLIFFLKKSFPINFKIIDNGKKVEKKTINIIIGDIIYPKSIPNLNHNLLG